MLSVSGAQVSFLFPFGFHSGFVHYNASGSLGRFQVSAQIAVHSWILPSAADHTKAAFRLACGWRLGRCGNLLERDVARFCLGFLFVYFPDRSPAFRKIQMSARQQLGLLV